MRLDQDQAEEAAQVKNTIILDFKPLRKWDFLDGVRDATGQEWDTAYCDANDMFHTKRENIERMRRYFAYSFQIFRRRRDYHTIIAWQQFFGILPAYFGAIFHAEMPKIYLIAFIYREKHGIAGKWYRHMIRSAFLHGGIQKAFVFSSNEPERYAKDLDLPKSYFIPETVGMHDRAADFVRTDDGMYIAAGRSNRDYRWLQSAWNDTEIGKLLIISDREKEETADNICVRTDIEGDALFERIASCHAVIIPLEDTGISSGQLVAIQAMMMGKPVIATENAGIREYVEDGVTGFVIPKTSNALQEALRALSKKSVYREMSRQARLHYENRYSQYEMGIRIGKQIRKWEEQA